jgi:hypothetical protein
MPDPAAEADGYPAFVRTADELETRIRFLLYAIQHATTTTEAS